jgi:outer membrane assembly lipoprotein YfiO
MDRSLAALGMGAFIFAWICNTPALAAQQSWELRDDGWQQVAEPVEPVEPDPMLDHVERLLDRGEHGAARRRIVRWLRENRDSPQRDRGLLLLARAYYQYGDRIRAFYHLDELMDQYPESPLFHDALQLQYDIADAFLRGYKMRFLRLPALSAIDEAIEMLYRIQQRSPGSPLAERALLRTADYYFQDGQFELSADAYAAYIRSYPRSPQIPSARLKQAFSNLAQFRGLRYDATPLLNARAQLVDLAAEYPQLAERQNLQAIINRIDSTFAERLLYTATFYRRTRQPLGAAYMYQEVIEAYPDSDQARRARRELTRLPQWAQQRIAARDEAAVPADEPAVVPDVPDVPPPEAPEDR